MVPEDWEIQRLGSVAEIQTGLAKGKKGIKNPVQLPYLRVANVQDGHLDLAEIKQIEVAKQEINRYLLRDGDVLLTEGGDFDKLGRGSIWRNQIQLCLHQNHVFVVRTSKSTLLPEFFSIQASSPYGKKYFLSCAKQTTNLASINSTQLKEFPVLLPPIDEQKKIAEILGSVDEAIAATQAVIDQTRKVKQGLLQQLLTRGIGHTKFKETAIGLIPECWASVNIGQVAEVGNGSTPSKARSDYWEYGTIPWISSGKVNERRICKSNYYITPLALKECPLRMLPTGTVLVAMIGQGKTRGMAAYLEVEATINQNLAYILPKKSLDGEFLLFYLQHNYEHLRSGGRGSNQDALNCRLIKEYLVPLPPIQEQREIVELISSIESSENEHIRSLAQYEHLKQGLMQDLLTGRVRVGNC